jgi:hypothetical protein
MLQLGAAGDGGDGLFAGGEGDLTDPVELLQCPVDAERLLFDVRVAQVSGTEPVADQRLGTAASTQIAMWPRTRFSVKWRIGRSPRVDLSTRKRCSTCWRDR